MLFPALSVQYGETARNATVLIATYISMLPCWCIDAYKIYLHVCTSMFPRMHAVYGDKYVRCRLKPLGPGTDIQQYMAISVSMSTLACFCSWKTKVNEYLDKMCICICIYVGSIACLSVCVCVCVLFASVAVRARVFL